MGLYLDHDIAEMPWDTVPFLFYAGFTIKAYFASTK